MSNVFRELAEVRVTIDKVVYVPTYQPSEVYGEWPYPETPPVYYPPSATYYPGYAYGAGLAFAAGVAVTAGLWGWANAGWRTGNININRSAYGNINVNRGQIGAGSWRAGNAGGVGRVGRPGGPVGLPGRPGNLPANAIGRGSVRVPGSAVNRPQIPGAGQRLGGGQVLAGGQRAGAGGGRVVRDRRQGWRDRWNGRAARTNRPER